MKKNKITILCNVLILFTTVFCAFGAESNKPSPQTPPPKQENVQLQTPAPSQPAPVLPISQNAYSYIPLGKPDPFKPFVEAKVADVKKEQAKAAAKTKIESIFPLQQAEVESFKLVGIMGDKSRRVAMVQDSAKKFYPLVIGTRIGLNNGKVRDILADRITVDELAGKKIKRIILKLRNN